MKSVRDDILDQLLIARSNYCLSILLPLHKTGTDRMQNQLMLDRATKSAKYALRRKMSEPLLMIEKLDNLKAQVNHNKPPQSIGLFVSPGLSTLVSFPFEVREKIVIDETFETRDLHYLKQFMAPYYALILTSRFVRLYFAEGSKLDEMHDGIFPMEYKEEYEYERSATGSDFGYGHKAYEKDKSSMTKLRMEAFYREAITHLQTYLKDPELPLVVAGTREDLGLFTRLNDIGDLIAAKVYGAFKNTNLDVAGEKAWVSLQKHRTNKELSLVKRLKETLAPNRVAKGIQEVWHAAMEGRGKLLLVEKDYHCRSYLKDGDPILYLRPPKGKYMVVPDAVDETLETVIEKGGKVLFTGNGSLDSFGSIALELRY